MSVHPADATGTPMRVVGLMSGTSADGIDAALLLIRPNPDAPTRPMVEVEASLTRPWPPEIRAAVHTVAAGDTETRRIARLRVELADGFAEATLALLAQHGIEPHEIAVLCCHGQTVWHSPPSIVGRGNTLQLLDPATLAARTGIPVVHDLRSADMAAGGHGAPLVAWPDRILFRHPERRRAVLNLGGMANVTLLGSEAEASDPLAFDIGPANALIDLAIEEATDGAEYFDTEGAWAARGVVDTGLLGDLLARPFFNQDPPRSTGREEFGPALIREIADQRGLVRGASRRGWEIVIATLTMFTVRAIARSFDRHLFPRGVDEILVAGGGTSNTTMMKGLADALSPVELHTVEQATGIADSAREAAAFALLGWAFVQGVPANVPSSTGSSGPRVLGSWTPSPVRPFHPLPAGGTE